MRQKDVKTYVKENKKEGRELGKLHHGKKGHNDTSEKKNKCKTNGQNAKRKKEDHKEESKNKVKDGIKGTTFRQWNREQNLEIQMYILIQI